jgi:4-carboxymuconolactone decarboxylase
MRLNTPRISPLEADQWDEEAAEVMQQFPGRSRTFNIFTTMANHPGLLRRWLVFANHVLGKSTLPAREREILILRIGYLCRAEYEWGQHVVIGKRAGLTDAEIKGIAEGPGSEAFGDRDRLLLQAADELRADAFIADGTWRALRDHFNEQQLMDIVFTVGQYNLVSMALNTFGVQLDPGLPTFEETT